MTLHVNKADSWFVSHARLMIWVLRENIVYLGAFWERRHHIAAMILREWILVLNDAMRNTHYSWQHTLAGKRIEPNEFAQKLCVRKIVTYNARLWGHEYGWGRHPHGSGLNGYIMWGKQKNKREFLNTLPVHHDHPPICHSSPKLWPTDLPPKNWAMTGWRWKWWVWQISQSDTTIFGAVIMSDVFNWTYLWESKVLQVFSFF